MIAVMWGTNDKSQPHFIHWYLVFNLVHEFGLYFALTKTPLNLTTSYTIGKGAISFNEFVAVQIEDKGISSNLFP